MKKLKKQMGAIMNVNNELILISRGLIFIFIPVIFLGFLWSGGDMYALEYTIWLIIVTTSAFGAYASREGNLNRGSTVEKIFLLIGLLNYLVAFLCKIFNQTRSPDELMLVLALVPFLIVYLLKRNKFIPD